MRDLRSIYKRKGDAQAALVYLSSSLGFVSAGFSFMYLAFRAIPLPVAAFAAAIIMLLTHFACKNSEASSAIIVVSAASINIAIFITLYLLF